MADVDHVVLFLKRFSDALGLNTTVEVEQSADGPRLNMAGAGA